MEGSLVRREGGRPGVFIIVIVVGELKPAMIRRVVGRDEGRHRRVCAMRRVARRAEGRAALEEGGSRSTGGVHRRIRRVKGRAKGPAEGRHGRV